MVQEKGCGALRNLAAGSEDRKTAVIAAGGLEAVLQAMGAHGGSAKVQENGCGALRNLALGSHDRQRIICELGGRAAIECAISAFSGNTTAERQARRTLELLG